ncbi:TolC family protein [Bdellovibrio svalbardensis]|uniref:TolC family protein n=1 Tax=Bdellovibrio svalbardensis TaxID=2972972 RepID=A0ABT6DH12_9BACT|nr:TolC family protein [Bdellovibrio svalbardensis]MDG0815762.1 TolC family protein [Bdellovibrio svalbardensis]
MSLKAKVIPMILMASSAWAEGAESCGVLSNLKQVISCAESRSPEVIKAQLEVKQKQASVEAAGQLLNPELSADALSGTVQSETRSETNLSLLFPVELGGKRRARKDVASGAASRAELELFNATAEVRKNVLLKVLRLRQIDSELDLVNESAEAFGKLVKQYEGRPALSPEQEVTLTVFRIAKDDYSFKRMEYDEELSQLASFFRISTGQDLGAIRKVMPARMPNLMINLTKTPAENSDLRNSPLLLTYDADIKVARAELDRAQGDAWPTLNVGPAAKFSKEAGQDIQQWGLSLSMPLPVLSLNQGEKAAANATVRSSQTRRELAEQELRERRAFLVEIYKKSAKALQETSNAHVLENKHKKVESMFVKGLVPSSLVIEVHRSLVEFEKTRNLRELKAVEAIFDIQIIDGANVELGL